MCLCPPISVYDAMQSSCNDVQSRESKTNDNADECQGRAEQGQPCARYKFLQELPVAALLPFLFFCLTEAQTDLLRVWLGATAVPDSKECFLGSSTALVRSM